MEIVNQTIKKFINEMKYLENEHVLGIFFYGSYLTGYNTKNSDIDLHVIFDNYDPKHLIRGNHLINGIKIEYFEKPIGDIYLSIENGYLNQNNACYSLFGKGKIVFERNNKLSTLQQYAINRFATPLPPLSDDEAKEQVAIINNRMERLETFAMDNDPRFEHLYHLTID